MKDELDNQTPDLMEVSIETDQPKTAKDSAKKAREKGRKPPKAWSLYDALQDHGRLYHDSIKQLQTVTLSGASLCDCLHKFDYLDDEQRHAISADLIASAKKMEEGMNGLSSTFNNMVNIAKLNKEGKQDGFKS